MARSPFGNSPVVQASDVKEDMGAVERFGVLQPQELILGLFGEYVLDGERAWSGGVVQLLSELGFSAAASRVALNRITSRGLLAPDKEGRFVFYTATERLKLIHHEGRRQAFSPVADVSWAGDWTLVWYIVPETLRVKRARVGRWLSLFGFGSLQDGLWIAPGDQRTEVESLLKQLHLDHCVVVLNQSKAADEDVASLVAAAWNVQALKILYRMFLDEFSKFLKNGVPVELPPNEAFVNRTRLIELFRSMTYMDPRLPDSVIGLDWSRREAIETFQVLQSAWEEAATSFFRGYAITGELMVEQDA